MTSSNTTSPLNAIAEQALGLDTPETAVQAVEAEGPTFAELGLSADIVSALTAAGYKTPTPVQQRAIPAGIAGRDLLVSSPTGSGKTAAFMLPAIERFAQLQITLASQPRESRESNAAGGRGRRPMPVARPSLLVLTPTRELAMQVTTAASTYGKHLKRLRTVSILGGVAYGQQLMLLAKNPEIPSPRRAVCSTIWSAAVSTCRNCRCWCSTKPTACSTWASSTTSRRSSPRRPPRVKRCCSRPRSTARSVR